MLVVDDLYVSIGDTEILHGLSLEVPDGEVHAIMGPNGSGKSTLAHVLAGRPPYRVTGGQVLLDGADLLAMTPEKRAAAGVFLGFQQPVEIPGVPMMYFLRTAANALRRARKQEELGARELLSLVEAKRALVQMDTALLDRAVNEGFSGGERKRGEILQMLVLEPCLAILDETDSGLDIDALRVVAAGVASLRGQRRSILVITHHRRLLEHLVPDRVHVLSGGRIVRSGGASLAGELEANGYGALVGEDLAAGAFGGIR
jgi:Fe-S cluster assembly ATP-binding protein